MIDFIQGLLNLSKSPDQKIAVKACEGLMLLVGLPEARAARILAECTSLGSIICSKLTMLVKKLPMTVDPADVEVMGHINQKLFDQNELLFKA